MEDRIKKTQLDRGFSLLELIVVIVILVTLAGIVAPFARTVIRDAKVARIVDFFKTISDAVRQYYVDTGKMPGEKLDELFDFANPGDKPEGWKGPYIDRYITDADNPTGYPVRFIKGDVIFFTIDGQNATAPGKSYALVLGAVSEEISMEVDKVIDAGVTVGGWEDGGRVVYRNVLDLGPQLKDLLLLVMEVRD